MPESHDPREQGIGAHPGAAGVRYRVWAPDLESVEVAVGEDGPDMRKVPLRLDGLGYWSGTDERGRAGELYRYRLPNGTLLPDPASRFQPRGVHGPSECIDPGAFAWRCAWERPGWRGQVLYELHVGTFSPEGTFAGAAARLGTLAELGVEAIELMPVADFAGDRNWGYDGVCLFAPARCYGRPDDLRALVDEAHALGMAVVLDVVYNHLGPQGNYLPAYCGAYFRYDKDTPWGRPFNLDGKRSGPVRAFLAANAAHWIDEYRLDGLRLDATHAIEDASPRHVLQEIADAAHKRGAFVVAEDERNLPRLLAAADPWGPRMDALWADDFHHEVRVALTGTRESHFRAYRGTPADIAGTLVHGWTYRGQPFAPWQGRPRGAPTSGLPPSAFIFCIENHDQVGNRARGERLEQLVSPAKFRAATLLLCLSPYPPLLFMGQEWAATSPFLFFTDHGGELGAAVSAGRRREFPGHGEGGAPDPEEPSTFEASRLNWEEREEEGHAATLALYRQCLHERRELARECALERGLWRVEHTDSLIAVRYEVTGTERMLLVSLGDSPLSLEALPEPFSAGSDAGWRVLLGSEDPRFGGAGHGDEENWSVRGPAALWLEAVPKGAHAP